MPHLQHLDGRPQSWAELHERLDAYYVTQLEPDAQHMLTLMDPSRWYKTNNSNAHGIAEMLAQRGFVKADRTPGRPHLYRRQVLGSA